jgi:hypothetical protein
MRVASRASIVPGKQFVHPDFGTIRNTGFFGGPGIIEPGPQAFLVELGDNGGTIRPHFHSVNQFQVFVSGDGRLGKKGVSRGVFQFADPGTPYGPIVANDGGVGFFTLRGVANAGAFYMPESREQMQGKAGRNIVRAFSCGERHERGVEREVLVAETPDLMAAEGMHLAPHATASGPEAPSSGGQYYLVIDGVVRHGDEVLEPDSLVWVDPSDPAPEFVAGPQGAHILMMQFPRPS